MKPVHAVVGLVASVGSVLWKNIAQIRRREGVDLVASFSVGLAVPEAVRPSDVVLGACPTDRWVLLVAVDVELDLALAPPVAVDSRPGKVRPHVVTVAFDPIDDGEVLGRSSRILPAPLCVEVRRLRRDVVQGVVDREVDQYVLGMVVFDFDSGALGERHPKVGVEPRVRHRDDRFRLDLMEHPVAVTEEVSQGGLDGRVVLGVPVHSDGQIAEDPIARGVLTAYLTDREPDVPDHTRVVDVGDGSCLSRGQCHRRTSLPAGA